MRKPNTASFVQQEGAEVFLFGTSLLLLVTSLTFGDPLKSHPFKIRDDSCLALWPSCFLMLRWMYPLICFLRGKNCNMQDIRVERWAHTLIHYSLSVKAGETIAIHATPLAAPLVDAVYREILRTG